MGVAVDPPLHAAIVHTVFGSVAAIDANLRIVQIRLLLGCDNLPEYVIGNFGANELIQTNVELDVPFDWVSKQSRIVQNVSKNSAGFFCKIQIMPFVFPRYKTEETIDPNRVA